MKENYYLLLGIDPASDGATIKRAYLARAKELHPDLNDGVTAADEMKALNLAYELLSDPARRAEYDKRFDSVKATRPANYNAEFDFDLAARDFASFNRGEMATLNHEYARMQTEGWEVERVHDHLVCTRTLKRRSIVSEYLTVIFGVAFGLAMLVTLSTGASEAIEAARGLLIPVLLLLGGGLAYAVRADRNRPPSRKQRVTVSIGPDGLPLVHVQPVASA